MRVLTAREQVEMLSPWRTAMPWDEWADQVQDYSNGTDGWYEVDHGLDHDDADDNSHLIFSLNPDRTIDVGDISVHPSFRGRGIAEAFMRRLHQDYPDHKIHPGGMTPDGKGFHDRMIGKEPGARDVLARTASGLWAPWSRDPEREGHPYAEVWHAPLETGHHLNVYRAAHPPTSTFATYETPWFWHIRGAGDTYEGHGISRGVNPARKNDQFYLPTDVDPDYEGHATKEDAMRDAEAAYMHLVKRPDTKQAPSEIDYESIINPHDDLDDEDYGHIFGHRTASDDSRWLRERGTWRYPEATQRLIDAVRAATGVRLDMEDTGGRSFVLSGRLEDGSWITAGEPVDGQNWWDAADREDEERDRGPLGWMVALHHHRDDEHGGGWLDPDSEPYHHHVDEGARNHELPRVVADALATAPRGATGRPPTDRGIDYGRAVNPRQEIDDDYGDIFGREGSRRVAGRPTTTDDVIRAVRDQHGIHLDMSNTGGGCYVLEGRLEDGSWLRAADHNDFCHPELADRHAEEERDGEPLGWDVDIYPNEHDPGGTSHDGKLTWGPSDNWGGEPIHSHSDPNATVGDLPRVIGDAFRTMPPGAKQRHQEKLRETLRKDGHEPGSAEWARHFPDEGGTAIPDYEDLINPKRDPRDDEDFGHIFGSRHSARVPDPTSGSGPLHSAPDDPVRPIPVGDLLRHRIFNPAITTPEGYHDSLWRPVYDSVPAYLRARPPLGPSDGPDWRYELPRGYKRREDADHGFRSQGRGGGTEDGLVEALERGDRLDPVEITTDGVEAVLTDGNHRAEVADMMSVPELDTRLVYRPHDDDLHWVSPDSWPPNHDGPRPPREIDPSSALGREVEKLVQDYPYQPVSERGFVQNRNDDRAVFRRDPATGLWQRGQAWWDRVDARRARDLDGDHEWDGPGTYHRVWFPGGERYVHERHLHAKVAAANSMARVAAKPSDLHCPGCGTTAPGGFGYDEDQDDSRYECPGCGGRMDYDVKGFPTAELVREHEASDPDTGYGWALLEELHERAATKDDVVAAGQVLNDPDVFDWGNEDDDPADVLRDTLENGPRAPRGYNPHWTYDTGRRDLFDPPVVRDPFDMDAPQADPDEHLDPDDPRIKGASRRAAGVHEDVMDAVRNATGVNLSRINTGGGLWAYDGRLDDGSWIVATDPDQMFDDLDNRHEVEKETGPVGWSVGVYPNSRDRHGTDGWFGEDSLHDHTDYDARAEDLPRVVEETLRGLPRALRERRGSVVTAQMSWDEVMRRIDEQLAQGEQDPVQAPSTGVRALPGWTHAADPHGNNWFLDHPSGLTGHVEDPDPGGRATWAVYHSPTEPPVAEGGGEGMAPVDAMHAVHQWIDGNHTGPVDPARCHHTFNQSTTHCDHCGADINEIDDGDEDDGWDDAWRGGR